MKILNFFLIILLSSKLECIQAQELGRYQIKDEYMPISLNSALAKGLKDNHDQISRNLSDSILDLEWEDAWKSFWFPKVTLNLSQNIRRIGIYHDGNDGFKSPTAPQGTLALNVEDYTVFNWGKDYLLYLNTKQTNKRGHQQNREGKRNLRHQIISQYFRLVSLHEIEQLKREQLRHASFVYRLNRERASARKIGKQDYYQSRAEFLRAKNEHFEAKRELELANEELAFLVDDPYGTKYIIRETLKFNKVQATLDNAYRFSERNNPTILAAKVGKDVSEREYDIAYRENLPLPTFSINLGTYTQQFGRSNYSGSYFTNPPSSSVEMVATINATWTVFGENGFFNKRKLEIAHLRKEVSKRNYIKQKDLAKSLVERTYEQVLNYEKQVTILDARAENARKTFDIILDNYSKKSARYVDFLHALRDYNESETLLIETKQKHLEQKVILANTSGVENFPGERFEDLALKKKELDELILEENE